MEYKQRPEDSIVDKLCKTKGQWPIRAQVVKNMNSRNVRNLCLTSKVCNQNICKDEKVWNLLAKERYGDVVPKNVNPIDYYYDRTIFLYNPDSGWEEVHIFYKLVYFSASSYGYGYIDLYSGLQIDTDDNHFFLGEAS